MEVFLLRACHPMHKRGQEGVQCSQSCGGTKLADWCSLLPLDSECLHCLAVTVVSFRQFVFEQLDCNLVYTIIPKHCAMCFHNCNDFFEIILVTENRKTVLSDLGRYSACFSHPNIVSKSL